MATGTVTRAEQNGQYAEVDVEVDEGLAGVVTYTGAQRIEDLKALPSNAARKQALLDAVTDTRDAVLQKEAIDAQLAQLIGTTVTV